MNTQKLEPVPGPWMAVGKVVKSDWGRDSVTVTRVDSRGKFVEGYDEANDRFYYFDTKVTEHMHMWRVVDT